jgi:hypothetical protein
MILAAYLLVSIGRLGAQTIAFQSLNVVGAAGFTINGWWHGALPSATLNIIWMLIGATALWRILRERGSSTSAT